MAEPTAEMVELQHRLTHVAVEMIKAAMAVEVSVVATQFQVPLQLY